MSLARPLLVALLVLSSAAAPPPPRAARRAATGTTVRPPVLPRVRVEFSLARFRPTSTLSGTTVGVAGPIDPDHPRVEASITASADTGWRYQIRIRGEGVDMTPRRLSRAHRLELEVALRSEIARNPALAEPLAYLIADLGNRQPPLALPIDLAAFTMVSADPLAEGGAVRGVRLRGFAGSRLLEIEMMLDGGGLPPRVRRWRPDESQLETARGRSRALDPAELDSLERILRRRARAAHAALDPSGLAAGILHRRRDARAADH